MGERSEGGNKSGEGREDFPDGVAVVASSGGGGSLRRAPKAGVEALIRGIAHEEGRFGIRASTVTGRSLVLDGGLSI